MSKKTKNRCKECKHSDKDNLFKDYFVCFAECIHVDKKEDTSRCELFKRIRFERVENPGKRILDQNNSHINRGRGRYEK